MQLHIHVINCITLQLCVVEVEVKINANEPILLDRWQGYLLKNLPLGQHKISLRLLDRQGKAIDKTIEKTFRLLE